MPDEKYVPADHFVAAIKILFSLINNLTISVMTLRAALMQAKALPIPPEELQRLHEYFHDYEPIRSARETMENLKANTSEDMIEFLRKFEGPLQ